MKNGSIILLNGASSAGKTSLSKAIQRQIDIPFWHVSSDQFVESGMLPRRDAGGDFAWPVMRPRFFRGFHRSLPAIASAGNNLIVEHVIEFQTWMDELVTLFAGFDVFFVGVHCPIPELERRERERGDRMIGEAHDHALVVHSYGQYDFELDSSIDTPDTNAALIIAAWQKRTQPSAFERMRR